MDRLGFEIVNRTHGRIITAVYVKEHYPENYSKY